MTNDKLLQVYEHQSIKIKESVNGVVFSQAMWEALAAYHEQHKGKYYRLTYKGVQFKQYVGIIQIGRWTIEILPKIDKSLESTYTWQQVLIRMLRYCRLIKTETAGVGSVRLTPHTILDLFFHQFLKDVQELVNRGLLKEYIPTEQNNRQLKGQLMMPKHLRYNLGHPERFYTKQHTFEEAHLFNQLLYEALKVLQQLQLSSALQALLQEIMAIFPPLPAYQWQERDFDVIVQHPNYRLYQSTIELTRLILLNFSADIRYGRHPLFALLFDMNILFEEYIFQQLQKQVSKTLKISRQRSIPFWRRKSIRPDLVLTYDHEKYIIDTKWKIISTTPPTPSVEDLRQVYVYCQYFKAKKGILLFPTTKASFSAVAQPFLDAAKDTSCQLLFVNVLTQQGYLNPFVGQDILDEIQM